MDLIEAQDLLWEGTETEREAAVAELFAQGWTPARVLALAPHAPVARARADRTSEVILMPTMAQRRRSN